jgi:Protein of unknown function (DUF2510)
MTSRKQRQPGWYPDASDPEAERYWDGTRWHGRRRFFLSNDLQAHASNPADSKMTTAVWVAVMMGSLLVAIIVMLLIVRAEIGR